MWGFHDRQLVLRQELYSAMLSSPHSSTATAAYQRRWRQQVNKSNLEYGLTLDEEEWTREWQYVVKLASAQPRITSKGSIQDTEAATNR